MNMILWSTPGDENHHYDTDLTDLVVIWFALPCSGETGLVGEGGGDAEPAESNVAAVGEGVGRFLSEQSGT